MGRSNPVPVSNIDVDPRIFAVCAVVDHANVACGPFYFRGLTLVPAWTSNYIHYKVWYEITYPFSNFNLVLEMDK